MKREKIEERKMVGSQDEKKKRKCSDRRRQKNDGWDKLLLKLEENVDDILGIPTTEEQIFTKKGEAGTDKIRTEV